MVVRDIIVIGGSAGSIEVLLQLLHDLPADLGASLFVVVHLPSDQKSGLPNILSRAGVLKATQPKDGERILPNRVYVAPPDRHLQLESDRIRVVFGPRENRARPAIDPLFRTAALNLGSRVVGVILSGRLDDGRNGLAQVKRFGGITIVQDPTDAAYSEMPRNALSRVSWPDLHLQE